MVDFPMKLTSFRAFMNTGLVVIFAMNSGKSFKPLKTPEMVPPRLDVNCRKFAKKFLVMVLDSTLNPCNSSAISFSSSVGIRLGLLGSFMSPCRPATPSFFILSKTSCSKVFCPAVFFSNEGNLLWNPGTMEAANDPASFAASPFISLHTVARKPCFAAFCIH